MKIHHYSEWDGSQDLSGLDADSLMSELARRIMSHGNLPQALRMMQRYGLTDSSGRQLPGLEKLLERLRQMRREQLDKYDLGSIMDDIRQKLDDILKMERQGIQKRLDEVGKKAEEGGDGLTPEMKQKLLQGIEDRAAKNLEKLDNLPKDVGGQIRELAQYDFMDQDARRLFQELMDTLKKNALQSYVRDLAQKLKQMDANSLAGLRNFIEAINQMLEQRLRGEEPDLDQFMKQYGDFFGPHPPQSLDELMERLRDQMAQAQSLLDSLSPADRQSLEEALRSILDEGTQHELAKMAANLEALFPSDRFGKRYPFSGEESLSYTEAMKLMETMQKMDRLEGQLRSSQISQSLDDIDQQLIEELMGNQAADEMDRLRRMVQALEEAGYIKRKDDGYELTPRALRRIGQKALQDIFTHLDKDRLGGHRLNSTGMGGEITEETKKYEFGDDFHLLHLQRTIMNSLYRDMGKSPPLKLDRQDFEMFRTEESARSAIVLMLDLSLSMAMRDNFEGAKWMAVALDNLIRSQFPKDKLYVVGFSSYAREIKKEDLPFMTWDRFDHGTNLQHALLLARKLLSKERANKEIILVTDGEPTAHLEGGRVFFQYPPSYRTVRFTLREVRKCTENGVIINTFMLENSWFLTNFVSQMARINKGRVFFTSANSLGKYVLVDYVSKKKKGVW